MTARLQIALKTLETHRSPLILGYLALTGVFAMLSIQTYLGSSLPPGLALATLGMIFGIYLLNQFTDVEEDATNDGSRHVVFEKRVLYLGLLALSLGGTFTLLAMLGKLRGFHIVVVVLGGAYSCPILPWKRRDGSWGLARLKDITLVKNLVVAGLWGAFMVLMPVLYSERPLDGSHSLLFLGGGFFVAAFCNTLFADVLDLPGDSIAGIPTLPVKFGVRFCHGVIALTALAWVLIVAYAFMEQWLDLSHLAVLCIPAVYPLTYIYSHWRWPQRRLLVQLLMETDLVCFAAGTWLLSSAATTGLQRAL